jgi:hypothetical protein
MPDRLTESERVVLRDNGYNDAEIDKRSIEENRAFIRDWGHLEHPMSQPEAAQPRSSEIDHAYLDVVQMPLYRKPWEKAIGRTAQYQQWLEKQIAAGNAYVVDVKTGEVRKVSPKKKSTSSNASTRKEHVE